MGRLRKVEVCDADFRLLFVCRGNICRSPFAQILTRHLFVSRLREQIVDQFHVSSAGVRAVGGSSMHTDSCRQLASWRLDTAAADGFVACQLQPAMGASAHLVLGVSPVARAHALIDEVRLVRGLAPHAEPDGDRVPDPIGRSPDAHRHAAELIEDAMQSILDVIALPLRVARGT